MSAGQLARQRSSSSGTRPSIRSTTPVIPRPVEFNPEFDFEPCAATASLFLFTQGSSIICLHHDTLDVERRFESHKEQILFLSVDNVSDSAGRYVVSYDASQTAIIWDLFTGAERARFASFEPIRAGAWLKNGSIAFGNLHTRLEGDILTDIVKVIRKEASSCLSLPHQNIYLRGQSATLSQPLRRGQIAKHMQLGTHMQIYRFGLMLICVRYSNGSILIVSLQPTSTFIILHTLTTPRAPSPIVNLAWHASSAKQRSDMLVTQTLDGDLRVWSIAKPAKSATPTTIRVLKQSDNVDPGLNWAAWSKNGRILQHSDGYVYSVAFRSSVAYRLTASTGKLGLGTSGLSTSRASLFQQSTA